MKTTWKMSLTLMSMLMLAGLTGCEQAEKTVDDVTESAKQTVDTAKAKAIEMLDGVTEKKDTKEEPGEDKKGKVVKE